MRQLAALSCLVLAGCLLDSPGYEGTEFTCAEANSSCPEHFVCVDQVCRPEGYTSMPGTPDAGASPADASTPLPDAGPSLMTVVVTADAIHDTHLDEEDPYDNDGDHQQLRVDLVPARPGLLRFDLAALPADAVIESADLSVYISEPLESGELVGYRMLEGWSEMEATWYQRKEGVAWTSVGAGAGSYDPTPLFAFAPRSNGAYTVRLPSALVQAWLDQALPNYGIRWTSNSPDGHGASFYSVDASSNRSPPQIEIRYRTASASAAPGGGR